MGGLADRGVLQRFEAQRRCRDEGIFLPALVLLKLFSRSWAVSQFLWQSVLRIHWLLGLVCVSQEGLRSFLEKGSCQFPEGLCVRVGHRLVARSRRFRALKTAETYRLNGHDVLFLPRSCHQRFFFTGGFDGSGCFGTDGVRGMPHFWHTLVNSESNPYGAHGRFDSAYTNASLGCLSFFGEVLGTSL